MNTYYLAKNLAVNTDTIIKHWETSDLDGNGYLQQNGTDRTLCEALTADGEWVLFAETNGDPVLLTEGNGDEFIDLLTSENSDESRDDIRKAILAAIKNPELRDWAATEL
jgi:hypothetical protein